MSQAAGGTVWRAYEELTSTNDAARDWLGRGAPHGAVVTAERQTAGRGRQGREWVSPPGSLALSMIVRERFDRLLSLRAGLAVARVAGPAARVKWPNDVLLGGRKVAGVLVELHEGAAIVGIGVNVAVELAALPAPVAQRAGTLGRAQGELRAVAAELIDALADVMALSAADVCAQLAARDALAGQPVRWAGGEGTAAGIGPDGTLRVRADDGVLHRLDGGEVHLL